MRLLVNRQTARGRVAAKIVLYKLKVRSELVEEGRCANRQRLTALVGAGTKLDQAACLVKEALVDVAGSGLVSIDSAQKITVAIDTYLRRILLTLELIS